jgi:hypothetical protein
MKESIDLPMLGPAWVSGGGAVNNKISHMQWGELRRARDKGETDAGAKICGPERMEGPE